MELSFKINKTKLITAAILLILIVAVVILAASLFYERMERIDTEIELKVKTQTIQTYLDKEGKLVARVEEYHKSVRDMKNSSDSVERKLYEEMRLSGLRACQIEKLQYALIESLDTLKTHVIDSVTIIQGIRYDKYARFSNNYLTADIYIVGDSTVAELNYKYTTELYMMESWTKPKFFLWRWLGFRGKNKQYDFKCSDPNANIKVLRSIITKKNK